MKQQVRLLAASAATLALWSALPAAASTYGQTRYPIVLVHGLLGVGVDQQVVVGELGGDHRHRLLRVAGGVVGAAFVVTLIATLRLEPATAVTVRAAAGPAPSLREALAEIFADPEASRFTLFIFVSMLAYSMQDLILEPFSGLVFGMTPGESTRLSGL